MLSSVHSLAGVLADQVETVLEGGEHPEAQQVELHQAHEGGVVLVPLDDGAVLHAGMLHRHDLADRACGEHHPAGVDAEVAGCLQQLTRVGEHVLRDVMTLDGFEPHTPAVHLA